MSAEIPAADNGEMILYRFNPRVLAIPPHLNESANRQLIEKMLNVPIDQPIRLTGAEYQRWTGMIDKNLTFWP